ncbi:DUF4440 domain-containing protein [Cetobacterium sp.]|uniref:nuclear transport factor 2 family protein n=1 Tax=Cetobacterium sp. TaxID=2071632 RepID=UPI003F3D5C93
MKSIRDEIWGLENALLKSEVRKSAKMISEILSEDFIEFCSSGSEYHYKRGDIFQEVNDNKELDWKIIDFKVKKISDECILATYKLIKYDEVNENKKYSIRSTIWKQINRKWKMVFHQGTNTVRLKSE